MPIIINQVSEAASRTIWNIRNVDTSVEAQRSAENERKRRMCAQRTDIQAVRELNENYTIQLHTNSHDDLKETSRFQLALRDSYHLQTRSMQDHGREEERRQTFITAGEQVSTKERKGNITKKKRPLTPH
ncbi:hypothetical protein PsorP6_016065 [Peronosclerospora sorghi]|uniref:Uncharacterized protein n=1 Tax=Peronosclerospora sorghi TaxID=230839 RepID=A0ACC0WRH3_9STRA|nr:hypothetical protein PsorP6_016065 [Peronosclerospora sorghi]